VICLCGAVSKEEAAGSLPFITLFFLKLLTVPFASADQQMNGVYRSSLLFHEHVL
jgi:hypothetical protein